MIFTFQVSLPECTEPKKTHFWLIRDWLARSWDDFSLRWSLKYCRRSALGTSIPGLVPNFLNRHIWESIVRISKVLMISVDQRDCWWILFAAKYLYDRRMKDHVSLMIAWNMKNKSGVRNAYEPIAPVNNFQWHQDFHNCFGQHSE